MFQSSIISPHFIQFTDNQLQQYMLLSLHNYSTTLNLFYRLLPLAQNEIQTEIIQNSIEIENLLLEDLIKLYYKYFGRAPIYDIKQIEFTDYNNALLTAIKIIIENNRVDRIMLHYLSGMAFYDDIEEAYRRSLVQHMTILSILTIIYNQLFYFVPMV